MGCTVYLPFNKWWVCMVNVGEYTIHLYVARTFYIFNLLVSLFWGEGGALGFRWKSTILPFFCGWWWCSEQTKLYDAVYSNKLCNETWTTFQQCLEAWTWEICLMFFWNFKTLKPTWMFWEVSFQVHFPGFGTRDPSLEWWDFFPTHFGDESESRRSTRVWFFQGGTQVFVKIFLAGIFHRLPKTCQKKSHLTSAFCVCFTPFVQGLLFPVDVFAPFKSNQLQPYYVCLN